MLFGVMAASVHEITAVVPDILEDVNAEGVLIAQAGTATTVMV